MEKTRRIVKRWFAGVLAVSMLATVFSTTAFAVQENVENTEPRTVSEWSWADKKSLVWDEDSGTWMLSLTYSDAEEEALDQDALAKQLPDAITVTAYQQEDSSKTEDTSVDTEEPTGEDTVGEVPAADSEQSETGMEDEDSSADTEQAEPEDSSVQSGAAAESENAAVDPLTVVKEEPAEETGDEAASAQEATPAARVEEAKAKAAPESGADGLDDVDLDDADKENVEKDTEENENNTIEKTEDTDTNSGDTDPVDVTEDSGAQNDASAAQSETLSLTWNYEALSLPLQPGMYTLEATLPEGYVLAEGAAALQVTLQVERAAEIPAASNDIALLANGNVVTDTVSPVGTTINMFDYWVNTQSSLDGTFDYIKESVTGINEEHAFKFSTASNNPNNEPNYYYVVTKANSWTGSSAVYSDIVEKTLQNGYPVLNGQTMQNGIYWEARRDSQVNTNYNYGESLDYLFDNSIQTGKQSWQDVKGLLRVDKDGYYYYDATQNYAQFVQDSQNPNTGSFDVYSEAAIMGAGNSGINGQFFPFFPYANTDRKQSTDGDINHYFGMTMTTRFVQMPNGTVDGTWDGTPVTYEFTGDDDVWVFIDDVLVGDLGGVHNKATLSINFQTGAISVNGQSNGTLRDKFIAAKQPWGNGSEATFADNTYHTLKFFYLERGNNESNMKLKFNLVSIPQSDLIKVDQTGDFIAGAKFNLYKANDDSYAYDESNLIATGTTDSTGSFVFTNTDGTLLSLNHLRETYGNNFVLKETATPDGYRSSGEMHLYFPTDYDEAILLSQNYWETGAYAMPMLTATLPRNPEVASGAQNPNKIFPDSDLSKGTYFAVVFTKQNGQWYPVSGDPLNGWTVHNSSALQDIINVAKTPGNQYVFTVDTSGDFKATIENLPGDILTYYHILRANDKEPSDAKYTVGYYYTTGPLSAANDQNTVRLNSDVTNDSDDAYFDREFAVRLYVPNIKNYIVVQKTKENGEALTDSAATFALFKADENRQDDPVKISTDDDGNKVVVYEEAEGANGTQLTQVGEAAQTRNLDTDVIHLDAAAVFPTGNSTLTNGTYYLLETEAPSGYAASTDLTKIIVDDTGVYANAGIEGDDITVLRGAGNIVRSMVQFAVPDHIDQTLTDIKVGLQKSTGKTGNNWNWQLEPGAGSLDLTYNTESDTKILDYSVRDPNTNNELYFAVEEGWSNVKITQNYDTSGKDYKVNLVSQDTQGNPSQTPVDLTNLFSRSTIVQVKNHPTGLTISKTVSSPIPSDKNISFKIQITAPDDSVNNQTFDYVGGVLATGEGKNSAPAAGKVIFANRQATIQLMDNQTITIQGLPNGSYTVTETTGNGYVLDQYTVNYGAGQTVTLDGTVDSATVAVTNTRNAGALELSKTVTGDFGDKTKYFEFTLTLKDASEALITNPGTIQAAGSFALSSDGTGGPTAGNQNVTLQFNNGVAKVYLKDSGEITLTGLPVGITCQIEETEVAGYDTTTTGLTKGNVTIAAGTQSVTFTNDCTLAPPTGLEGDTGAYQLMLSMAGLAVMAAGAGWIMMRRRKRREEE